MVGILVDTVQKMIDVDTALILPSPSQDTRNLVSGMCSLKNSSPMVVKITASRALLPFSGEEEAWEALPLKVTQLS